MGQADETVLIVRHGRRLRLAGCARLVWRAAGAVLAVSSVITTAVAAQPPRSQATARTSRANADSARLVADRFFRAAADEQYELKRYQEQVAKFDIGSMLSYQFSGVRTVEELRQLTPVQAAVRFLQAQDLRVQVRERARQSGCGDLQSTGVMPPFAFHRIIATALASDTVAYVLHDDGMFTSGWEGAGPLDPMVMQLRWRGGAWLIVPSRMLLGRTGTGFAMQTSCDTSASRRRGG